VAPPVPHALGEGVVQTLPLQQPPGQLVPSHTQVPATQRWPLAHAAPAPHWHTPVPQ
jgi:hypothetical protein